MTKLFNQLLHHCAQEHVTSLAHKTQLDMAVPGPTSNPPTPPNVPQAQALDTAVLPHASAAQGASTAARSASTQTALSLMQRRSAGGVGLQGDDAQATPRISGMKSDVEHVQIERQMD